MAIGRLDEDSEGLLLLTTCGKTSNDVRDRSVEKEYYCQVDGQITEEAISLMKAGLEISIKGSLHKTLPCDAKILDCGGESLPDGIPPPVRKIRDSRHGPTTWVSITIREGKYRQVRKMTAATGFATLRLVRVRVAGIDLDGLSMGEVREVMNIM
jgi:23S rRNA pseudouridine2457 synthase